MIAPSMVTEYSPEPMKKLYELEVDDFETVQANFEQIVEKNLSVDQVKALIATIKALEGAGMDIKEYDDRYSGGYASPATQAMVHPSYAQFMHDTAPVVPTIHQKYDPVDDTLIIEAEVGNKLVQHRVDRRDIALNPEYLDVIAQKISAMGTTVNVRKNQVMVVPNKDKK